MKNMFLTAAVLLASSSSFAQSTECSRQLDSMLYRQSEISRLETSALVRSMNGEIEVAQGLNREVARQKTELEQRKAAFVSDCLTK